MAITLNNSNVCGIATLNPINLATIDSGESVVDLEITVKEAKEPLFILFDSSECIVPVDIKLLNADGKAVCNFNSTEGKLNVIPVTTLNYADGEGKIKVRLDAYDNVFSKDMSVKIGTFSHTPVINR